MSAFCKWTGILLSIVRTSNGLGSFGADTTVPAQLCAHLLHVHPEHSFVIPLPEDHASATFCRTPFFQIMNTFLDSSPISQRQILGYPPKCAPLHPTQMGICVFSLPEEITAHSELLSLGGRCGSCLAGVRLLQLRHWRPCLSHARVCGLVN